MNRFYDKDELAIVLSALADALARRNLEKGNKLIQKILVEKGSPEDEINTSINKLDNEKVRALNPAKKKWARVKGDTVTDRITKKAAYLSTRGFPSDVCWDAARQVADTEIDETELDVNF